MATDLIEIDAADPSDDAIARAAAVILRGGVVAIPTDSRYLLVADPFNLRAVARTFAAKGREIDRSLPLLVNDHLMAEDFASGLSNRFYLLARRFWPGALTIIVTASPSVPLKVTGNTGRLGLRRPKSPSTEKLVERLNQPLIATSANLSGSPTCSSGIDVFGTMDGRIDLVLDGGFCDGSGATTVDITEPFWRVIKEGAVEEREIADCLRGS